ncbi:penicillin-binding protein [Geomonas limicola]|uniref:Penicillin-binding protein n=1 Tax=Geomonas limicola TaxID=2740186 RepID=A0A6V8N9V5_9BACT|nr:penicillin-binding transpeptidase domain-containing protein [Geomonas limicola]GFO69362.1 penicillin-binding protein [Geomonas limicola]
MQDFKDIDNQSRRRRQPQATRKPELRTPFSDIEETPPKRRRLKIILPVLALLLACYPLISLFGSTRPKTSAPSPPKSTPFAALTAEKVDSSNAFRLAAQAYPNARPENGTFCAPLPQGGTVVYAINEAMQRRVEKVFNDYKVPYGLFVAIEPKTGKVLATVAHSSVQPGWEQNACYNLYPMASLFKIVTATAALEEKKVTADTAFAFNGRLTSENPKYWRVRSGRGQQMSLTMAMGKSVNPVFGRLAGEFVGRDPLLTYAGRYGFNQELFPGSPAIPSRAPAPGTIDQLMRMGAGLDHEVKTSPFHAATIMATVANNGVMMTPSLAQQIFDAKGKPLFTQQPKPLRTVFTPQTANELARMLSTTVVSGTSRKAFHDRRGRPLFNSLHVAAKTGSIDGKDPAGHYSWFAAYAPMEDPQVAIAALVINQNKWRIKATHVGEQALEAFFK